MSLTRNFPGHETIYHRIYQLVARGLVETKLLADTNHKNVTGRDYRFTLITENIRIFQIYKYLNFIFSYQISKKISINFKVQINFRVDRRHFK